MARKVINKWGVDFVLQDLAFRKHCKKLMERADMLRQSGKYDNEKVLRYMMGFTVYAIYSYTSVYDIFK